jgi:recombinational DNA repair protein RecR
MIHNWDNEESFLKSFVVDKEIRQKRIDICKSCENLTDINVCTICNCVMPLKTWIIGSSCPINKWGSVE